MAIASVGTMGTGASSTSSTTFTLTTATNSLASGDFALLTVVADNTATADGNTNTITGVSGGTGTWTKLGEYTNTVGGVAADGVCTAVFLFEATGTVNTGTVMTITLSAARVDKCASMWKFTKASGYGVRLDPDATTNPVTNGTDAANGFGSVAFSGLPSQSRLYYRGLGKEANSTTDITVSTSFTAITLTRSRNNASAVLLRGEFRINTSTGETSNPTLAVTGDTAAVFVALEEFLPARTGTLAATEAATADTFSSSGKVEVKGSAAATESATKDTLASTGKVVVQGSLAVTEAATADTFAATGQLSTGISGTLAATETGADTFSSTGKVLVKGSLAVTEVGADTFSSSGKVLVAGALSVTEVGTDTFASTGKVVVQGALALTESGQDTLAATGKVLVQGALAGQEVGQDTFYATSSSERTGTLDATESGSDGFAADGTVTTPVVSGGGLGRVLPFSPRSGLVQEKAYKRSIAVAKRAIKAAQKDPLLARESEFKKLLSEAYRAFQELAKLQEVAVRNKLMAEYKRMREIEVELAMRAEEEEDMALLAASLW